MMVQVVFVVLVERMRMDGGVGRVAVVGRQREGRARLTGEEVGIARRARLVLGLGAIEEVVLDGLVGGVRVRMERVVAGRCHAVGNLGEAFGQLAAGEDAVHLAAVRHHFHLRTRNS